MKKIILLILFVNGLNLEDKACTIVSGIDKFGNTWVMNNEDFPHTYTNYLNVFPLTKNTLGYITLTYGSPTGNIQGGANEAGLFYDYNDISTYEYKLSQGKKQFDGDMGLYLLQHCKSVPEFLKLWETYYNQGMNSSQMHVADKFGNLAVITPDTIIISKGHLTSTNFKLCGSDNGIGKCWRFPIAEKQIADNGVSQKTLLSIAKSTARGEFTTTVYTNIHNLSTGQILFYLAEDYEHAWDTNIFQLLKGGEQHILLATKFPKNAGLKLKTLIDKGSKTDKIQEFLKKGNFSVAQKEKILRLNFLNYLYMEKDFNKAGLLFPIWEKYISSNKKLDTVEVKIAKALVFTSLGKSKEAIAVLDEIKIPSGRKDELLNSLLNNDNKENNAVFKLEGYQNAKVVLLEINGDYSFFRLLINTPEGWVLKMKTSKNELQYCFYVDGKRIVNSSQPIVNKQETERGDFADFNILKL